LRLIRPLLVARVVTASLAVAICLPAVSASAATQKSTRTHQTVSKKKHAYSAHAASSRRATLARARANARVNEQVRLRGLQEAMTPRYKTDASGAVVPDVRAAAAIIFNPVTGQILYEENSQDKRSIASITKVMTALVFLEDNPDLNSDITIERSDVFAASTTYLRANDHITDDQLLHLLLIASDNGAARALARTSHGGTSQFVERMNEKAIELGLENTSFADPSGLNPDNVSSAFDLSHLITFAASDERISSIMRTPTYTVTTNRRMIPIHSTNHLLTSGDVDVMGGKTGFIGKAGYCLATLLRLPQGNPVAVVVLGAHSNNGRFWETRHLFNWLSEKTGTLLVKEPPKSE
jgi:D-alanyl-D-alanine endopeptidase (penicillin-binding protein 7)